MRHSPFASTTAALLGAALLGGCGSAAPLVTVQQLLAHCDAYKGKPVQLAGYLGECAGFECHIAGNQARYAEWVALFNSQAHEDLLAPNRAADLRRMNALWPVGVGGNDTFDAKAKPLQHRNVVITGHVAKDNCTGVGGTDRSPGIEPTDIRAWTPSEGAPANTH